LAFSGVSVLLWGALRNGGQPGARGGARRRCRAAGARAWRDPGKAQTAAGHGDAAALAARRGHQRRYFFAAPAAKPLGSLRFGVLPGPADEIGRSTYHLRYLGTLYVSRSNAVMSAKKLLKKGQCKRRPFKRLRRESGGREEGRRPEPSSAQRQQRCLAPPQRTSQQPTHGAARSASAMT
jgi:hypothetical protein